MTRRELIERLDEIKATHALMVDDLIKDINGEGVLDVQAPADIAEAMNLPRPTEAAATRRVRR